MTRVTLTPIVKDSQPTSHVTVGRSKIGSTTEVVKISHRGRTAFFRVETENDRVMDTIGNNVYINSNIADLFGGIDRTDGRFDVITDVSEHAIPACESATLYVHNANPERLAEVLREERYLLHRIEEVAEFGSSPIRFTVNEMTPSDYPTLQVTDDTEFEFADGPVEPMPASEDASRGGDESTGERRGGSGPAAETDGPTVEVEPTEPTVNLDEDVAGLEDVKATARMLLSLYDPNVRDEIVDRYGEQFVDRSGSMLMYGPPGCGKTYVAEAIAHEAKYETSIVGEVKYVETKGSDIQSKYSGESEKNVREVFDRAGSMAQDGFVVLFFDEIETLIPDRSDDNLQRHERALTNAFLQEMNEIPDNLFVIGATNMPFAIDSAANRRFPIQQFIEQPGAEVMAEVWRTNLSTLPNADAIDFEELGELSVGYTPAEIADRVLGSDLQRELIQSVVEGNPTVVDTDYLRDRLAASEPRTIDQYLNQLTNQLGDLDGFPEMKEYVVEQTRQRVEGDQASNEDNDDGEDEG